VLPYVLAAATFFSTLLGGLLALRQRHRLAPIMAFASGLLISAALLDLLPEGRELAEVAGLAGDVVFVAAAVGFLAFFALDRFVHSLASGHGHGGHEGPHQAFGGAAALGLVVHSALDGAAIGAGFQAGEAVGLLVATAVLAHRFGDGVTTVAVVLGARASTRASLGWLVADAAAPIVGAALTLLVGIGPQVSALLLGFFAGSFLFIGASHLLPEAGEEHGGVAVPGALLAGFVFVFVVTRLLGGG
jgi:ZIP family zinc transporter